jgi:hypothetical protein
MILLSPARQAGSARAYGAILTAPPDRQVMRYTEIRAVPCVWARRRQPRPRHLPPVVQPRQRHSGRARRRMRLPRTPAQVDLTASKQHHVRRNPRGMVSHHHRDISGRPGPRPLRHLRGQPGLPVDAYRPIHALSRQLHAVHVHPRYVCVRQGAHARSPSECPERRRHDRDSGNQDPPAKRPSSNLHRTHWQARLSPSRSAIPRPRTSANVYQVIKLTLN